MTKRRKRRQSRTRALVSARGRPFVLAAILVVVLGVVGRSGPLPADVAIAHSIQSIDLTGFETAMRVATWVGSTLPMGVLTLLVAVWLFRMRIPLDAAFMVLTIPVRLSNELFKQLVERPRPTAEQVAVLVSANGYSFPSGHSVSAVVFFGFLGWLAARWIDQRWLRPLPVVLSLIAILAVGLSRVYLGAHWPSDVVGGYLVGLQLLIVVVTLHELFSGRTRLRIAPGPPTYSDHAVQRMRQRHVSEREVEYVLADAERAWVGHSGRPVLIGYPDGRRVKVVVAPKSSPPHIVTVAD